MKKHLLTLSFVIGFWFCGRAQWASIPDTLFGTWLNTHGYSTCLQGNNSVGWQMDTTCNEVVSATYLNCSHSWIGDITGVQYFDNLDSLDCSHTSADFNATILPPLPNLLRYLNCISSFELTDLPTLPSNLRELWANENGLQSLPTLPDSLKILNLYLCGIGSLPPTLPSGLTILVCRYGSLSSLPPLPNTITYLDVSMNHLSSLPELPDYLGYFNCSFNPIYCFPQLKRVGYFYFSNTNITCLPNYPLNTYSDPPLSSIPICDIFNANNCSVYWNISGNVFFDENTNCIHDGIDTSLYKIKVLLLSNGVVVKQTFTDVYGNYFFDTDTLGTYTITIDTANIPFEVSCPFNGINTADVTVIDSFITDMDFALVCKQSATFDVGVTSVVAGVHGVELFYGVDNTVRIQLQNDATLYGIGCNAGVSGNVILNMSGSVTYVSPANGSSAPNSVSGDTVTWNVLNFDAFNSGLPLDILVHVDSVAQLGQLACFTIIVTHPLGDNNLANDTLTRCFEIGLPIDPNGKDVYPAGNIDSTQHALTYTIFFQNTGTASARNIYIDDTLDTDLDKNSFQLLAYSHEPLIQLKENAVRFNYPNINLADSTHNEVQSHGYVQYSIKSKANLDCGTQIGTPAFIYFDFNSPVVTNIPLNTIRYITTTNLQANICSGENYDFHGISLNISGDYTDTLQTVNACDSVVTLSLIVFSNFAVTVHTSITQGNSYTLPSGNVVSTTGTYNDTLHTINNCDSIITTHLDVVSSIQPSNSLKGEPLRINPNPASSLVNILVDETLIGSTVTIYDVTGRKIMSAQLSLTNNPVSIASFARGVYFVTVKNTAAEWNQKLIVE